MNKTISIGAGVVLFIGVLFLLFSGQSKTPAVSAQLSGSDFVFAYKSTAGATLLDVRTPSEFEVGHLNDAVNVDFENPSFASELQKLDKTKPYFVYCRSGNRSGQAVAMMKKEGFTAITELKGGLISNQNLELVTTTVTATSTEEYVVDQSDMVNGVTLVADIPASTLSEKEKNGLIQMREEEKLAHDVYTTLGSKWNIRVFSNIASSEQTHTDAVKVLLDRYEIPDPSANNTVGVFQSPEMQKLYTDLVAKGSTSLSEALVVGATVEDLDINDLDILMKETTKQDILVTYTNLQRGSRNHMRAFVKNLSASGGTYVPQYISKASFDAIIGASQERGGGR